MKVVSEVNKDTKRKLVEICGCGIDSNPGTLKQYVRGHCNCVETLSIFIKTNNPLVVMVTGGRWSTLRNLICAKHWLGNSLQNIQFFWKGVGCFHLVRLVVLIVSEKQFQS